MSKNEIEKNKALRRLACECADPNSFYEDRLSLVKRCEELQVSYLEVVCATEAGLAAQVSPHRCTDQDPIVLWSKGRDFGDCEEWGMITECAKQ